MARNTYVPAGLTNTRAYNWSRSAYISQNVPPDSDYGDPGKRWQSVSAYEWLDYGQVTGGIAKQASSNPPFREWEAGRLPADLLAMTSGGVSVPARILRGYIRRAEYNRSDAPSMARLYFMYNPEKIERQYVSYLDQGALDPFNTVYQSGNLVAPPSFMDFTFELFFDRQAEATNPNNPGVLVDQEFFDLVVRNVVPGSEYTNGSIPDNGVMMVNPRDITVIFSPTMSIQGRPLNSSMVFEKFTHRMTPTRMRIALTMRVIYIGPPRDMTVFTQETINIQRRVPIEPLRDPLFTFTYEPLEWEENGEDLPVTSVDSANWIQTGSGSNAGSGALLNVLAHTGITDSNGKSSTMTYTAGAGRANPWVSADCSGLVWMGFMETAPQNVSAYGRQLDWKELSTRNAPDVIGMWNTFSRADATLVMRLYGFGMAQGELNDDTAFAAAQKMSPGDLLVRYKHPDHPATGTSSGNHIAFLWKLDGGNVWVVHASDPSHGVCWTKYPSGSKFDYNYGCRILAAGANAGNTAQSVPNTPGA